MHGTLWMKQAIAFTAVTVLLFVMSGASSAFTQADLDKLNSGKACEKCNLRGANLSGRDLSGYNLTGAQLIQADLRGANLTGANLKGANLGDANLHGANLTGADFTGARWTDGFTCRADSIGKCQRK